jgi:hypothetical protein
VFEQRARDEIRAEENYRISRRGSQFGYDARTTTAHDELAAHYWALQEKYDQAAARPWLVVAPDPPEPAWPKDVPRDPPRTKQDVDRRPTPPIAGRGDERACGDRSNQRSPRDV